MPYYSHLVQRKYAYYKKLLSKLFSYDTIQVVTQIFTFFCVIETYMVPNNIQKQKFVNPKKKWLLRRFALVGVAGLLMIAVTIIVNFIYSQVGTINDTARASQSNALVAWGSAADGALGNGVDSNLYTFTKIPNLRDVIKVSSGINHTIALKSNGDVYAWGLNNQGQLGAVTGAPVSTPVHISSLSNIVDIAAGGNQSVAVKGDGTVWAWGNLPSHGVKTQPIQIPEFSNIVKVGTQGFDNKSGRIFGLDTQGSVYGFGDQQFGALGNGTNSKDVAFVRLPISEVSEISIPQNDEQTPNLALKKDGTVWAWGMQVPSSLVDCPKDKQYFENGEKSPTCLIVAPLTQSTNSKQKVNSIVKIATGSKGFALIDSSQRLRFNPTPSSQNTTSELPDLSSLNIVDVTIGNSIMVKTQTGDVYGLLGNQNGQLGLGDQAAESVTTITPLIDLKDADYLTSSESFNLAILKQGETTHVYGAGNNGLLQLGNVLAGHNPLTPIQITNSNLTNAEQESRVKLIRSGKGATYAVRDDGTVWVWGNNENQRLGTGSMQRRILTPTQIPKLSGIVDIEVAPNGTHALAISENGQVWGWGSNEFGQLGLKAMIHQTTPTMIPGIENITKVSTSNQTTLALDKNGLVKISGVNSQAQNDTKSSNNNEFVDLVGISNISDVLAGTDESLTHYFLDRQGRVIITGLVQNGSASQKIISTNPTILAGNSTPLTKISRSGCSDVCFFDNDGYKWIRDNTQTANSQLVKSDSTIRYNLFDGVIYTVKTITVETDDNGTQLKPTNVYVTAKNNSWLSGLAGNNTIQPVSEHGVPVNNIVDAQWIATNGETIYAIADLAKPLAESRVDDIQVYCNSTSIDSTTTCNFTLPALASLPPVFGISVGDATPAGSCSSFGDITIGQSVTCTSVPTGTLEGDQLVYMSILGGQKVSTGETIKTIQPVTIISEKNILPGTCSPGIVIIESSISCSFPLTGASMYHNYALPQTELVAKILNQSDDGDSAVGSSESCTISNGEYDPVTGIPSSKAILECKNIPTTTTSSEATLGNRTIAIYQTPNTWWYRKAKTIVTSR